MRSSEGLDLNTDLVLLTNLVMPYKSVARRAEEKSPSAQQLKLYFGIGINQDSLIVRFSLNMKYWRRVPC